MGQRLKQHNEGARLLLTTDDFLIARQTPWLSNGVLYHVRRRVGRDGYAEQSVHEHGRPVSGFWYTHTALAPERLADVGTALLAAFEAMAGVPVPDDPDGVFRCIEFWKDEQPTAVRMQDIDGTLRYSVPAFEQAWRQVVDLFPSLPSRGNPA